MSIVSPVEVILEEARAGRPFILVDAEDRENEGDIVIPAGFATPEVINFMARHARGLICLAMDQDRARRLQLEPMTPHNSSGHGTAFTVSIEAREGVTTGISAHDRARTIAVAIDPATGAEDIATPGHVLPLVARAGGVLERPGHTEAAVDIARLAGLTPAGVICEVMNEDGSMARLPDLMVFAARHGLKIGTIADLIAWRKSRETLVERLVQADFPCRFGNDFQGHVYRDLLTGGEHLALTRGEIRRDQPTLVRVHPLDLPGDLLGWQRSPRDMMAEALTALAGYDGPAVAVFVQDHNPQALSERLRLGRRRYRFARINRDYGIGAQILRDLGVGQMRVISPSRIKASGLENYGLSLVEVIERPRSLLQSGSQSVTC